MHKSVHVGAAAVHTWLEHTPLLEPCNRDLCTASCGTPDIQSTHISLFEHDSSFFLSHAKLQTPGHKKFCLQSPTAQLVQECIFLLMLVSVPYGHVSQTTSHCALQCSIMQDCIVALVLF